MNISFIEPNSYCLCLYTYCGKITERFLFHFYTELDIGGNNLFLSDKPVLKVIWSQSK